MGGPLEWLIDRVSRERFDILRLPDNSQYLTRWTLWGKRMGGDRRGVNVNLHCFHRSDLDEMHDHPWPFVSVILSGGYWEHTPAAGWKDGVGPTRRRWYGRGRVLIRPALHIHRVEIPAGRKCWTLFITGPKARSWGFWCSSGYLPWREHAANVSKTGSGCP